MAEQRYKDRNWNLAGIDWDRVPIAVLMDIRDELQRANGFLADIAAPLRCQNFLRIPAKLDAIQRNTKKKPRKKAAAKTERRVA